MTRFALALAAMLYIAPTSTVLHAETPLLEQAATCTGRLSAFLETQWAHNDARADKTAILHNHMTDFMFALVTEKTDRASRLLRADAKKSFRALLVRTQTSTVTPRARKMAAGKARNDLRACVSMIVPQKEVDAALGFNSEAPLLLTQDITSPRADIQTASR